MKLQYLGDALDFWKGAFIDQVVRPAMGKRRLYVVPMITDADQWTKDDLKTYAGLLGVKVSEVVSLARFPGRSRAGYFEEVCNRVSAGSVFFLDPDTGVSPSADNRKKEHVTPEEIRSLVAEKNVAAVYQHAPRSQQTAQWIQRYIDRVSKMSLNVIGYQSGTVGMLFVSAQEAHIKRIRRKLEARLGTVASAERSRAERIVG